MKRVHAYYSGDVQGVGFRFTVVDEAQKFGVTGWVKNCADGKVEVVAEGVEETLKKFLADLEKVMSRCVRDKKISWEPATQEFVNFQIVF